MSDDWDDHEDGGDWGDTVDDDNAWEDDNPKKPTGTKEQKKSNDDDNGNGGDDDDWDVDNDMQSNDDGFGGSDNEEELTVDVQIANIFYEAEDVVRENKQLAITKFQQLLTIAKDTLASNKTLNDESMTNLFKAYQHLTVLLFQQRSFELMLQYYQELLKMVPNMTRNESAEAIDTILNTVSNTNNTTSQNTPQQKEQALLQQQVYAITSKVLKSMNDTERMLFNVNMKLCKSYLERDEYASAEQILSELHTSCQVNGIDDKRKGSELLEIYSIRMRLALTLHPDDLASLKELYEKTKDLTSAVKDPRSQSVIRECWGQMFGHEGLWQKAYAEFYSAFLHYQEIGQREKAKQCLKYVVVSNMLSNGSHNPFDAREAKVYQHDPDISAIVSLRSAYEKCDITTFTNAMEEINKNTDTFIRTHLLSMMRDFHGRAIVNYMKSYRRIRLSFLASMLKLDEQATEALVVQLILNGEIQGKIDQVNGILDVGSSNSSGQSKKFEAIDTWIRTLTRVSNSVHSSLATSGTSNTSSITSMGY